MVGLILQLAGLALAITWAAWVWGVPGALLAGGLVLVFLGFVFAVPDQPEQQAGDVEGEGTEWIS